MEHDSKVVWGEGGTTLVEWKWKDLDGEDFAKMMGWLVDRNQEGCKLRLKDNAFLTQMDKTLAWRRWTASSWPPASPPSPPARRGWRPGRDWPPRRPARWCGTPAIVQLVMWSRSWLVWGQTLPGHNGPRALKSAMTHPTPLMETGIRLSMAFVPASTTLLLFNSDVNNVALVFSWRQQHGFCLLRHQQHGYWFVPISKTWLPKLTTVGEAAMRGCVNLHLPGSHQSSLNMRTHWPSNLDRVPAWLEKRSYISQTTDWVTRQGND